MNFSPGEGAHEAQLHPEEQMETQSQLMFCIKGTGRLIRLKSEHVGLMKVQGHKSKPAKEV